MSPSHARLVAELIREAKFAGVDYLNANRRACRPFAEELHRAFGSRVEEAAPALISWWLEVELFDPICRLVADAGLDRPRLFELAGYLGGATAARCFASNGVN